MITITMEMPIKPGMLPAFQTAIAAAIKQAAARPGCRGIRVLPPMQGEDKALIYEEWDSADDHKAYLAWRAEGNPAVGMAECVAGPPTVQFWGEVIATA